MNKIFISAVNPLQAEEYAKYIGLNHDDWIYLRQTTQLIGRTSKSVVISLRSAVILDDYVTICEEVRTRDAILINVGW